MKIPWYFIFRWRRLLGHLFELVAIHRQLFTDESAVMEQLLECAVITQRMTKTESWEGACDALRTHIGKIQSTVREIDRMFAAIRLEQTHL